MNKKRIGKLLFAHTPKAAGSYVGKYIEDNLRYRLVLSENRDTDGVWIDFTLNELLNHMDMGAVLLQTHALSYGWHDLAYSIPSASKEEIVAAIRAFKTNGWFTFTFIRHPGEMLCSFYHYVYGYHRKGLQKIVDAHVPLVHESLDQFLQAHCDKELLPAYWKEFDFVAEASDANLKHFFGYYLNHDYKVREAHRHASGSEGYTKYCRDGSISKETQLKIEGSANMRIYNGITSDEADRMT